MSENRRILIFGKNGQLGSALRNAFQAYEVFAYDVPEIDFTDTDTLDKVIDEVAPLLLINAAAYTAVDRAEEQEELANQINGHAVGHLAKRAKAQKTPFIHYSTDYVFDGLKDRLYTEDDAVAPLNVYGSSKLLGEQLALAEGGGVIVARTSWVYSVGGASSFVTKLLGWARKQTALRIVDDQVSNPSWTEMLADMTYKLAHKSTPENLFDYFSENAGLYHVAGKGAVSRYDWALRSLDLDPNKAEQTVTEVSPAKSSEFPTPVDRPLFSGLDVSKFEKTFGIEIPTWEASLVEAFKA